MIPLFKVFMAQNAAKATAEVLNSGYLGQGPKVDEFEKQLAEFLHVPDVNAVNSGTSGLHLILHMLKSQSSRDEVLTTPLTCTATNFPIVANGLKIKWCDIDPNTCNLDLQDVRRKLSRNTLAIMAVHWGGYPCDLDELKKIQLECQFLYGYRPPIIEDCAHAFGAIYKSKMLGNHGNYCMFSFQAIKHLTTGDGGMIVCPTKDMHNRAKLLRWYGLDRTSSADFRCDQNIGEAGFKFHMNDIAAAIGIENLKYIDMILAQHRHNACVLRRRLAAECSGVKLLEEATDRISSEWVLTIRVERRDDFIRKMKEKGIVVSRVHDRNDKHYCLQEFKCSLPNTDIVCADMCCIPCGWWVEPPDINYIIESIKEGW